MPAVAIPDIFTAYINGREQAIQANWNDLNNYNNVLQGQLNNAATMADFDANRRKNYADALNSQFTTIGTGLMTEVALQQYALQQQNNVPWIKAQAEAANYRAAIQKLDTEYQQQRAALEQKAQAAEQQAQAASSGAPNAQAGAVQPANSPAAAGTPTNVTPGANVPLSMRNVPGALDDRSIQLYTARQGLNNSQSILEQLARQQGINLVDGQ